MYGHVVEGTKRVKQVVFNVARENEEYGLYPSAVQVLLWLWSPERGWIPSYITTKIVDHELHHKLSCI